jgi:Ring finger domain
MSVATAPHAMSAAVPARDRHGPRCGDLSKQRASGEAEAGEALPGGVCSICHESLLSPDGRAQNLALPCAHVYHAQCIRHWLELGNSTCPICRRTARLPSKTAQLPPEATLPAAELFSPPPSPASPKQKEVPRAVSDRERVSEFARDFYQSAVPALHTKQSAPATPAAGGRPDLVIELAGPRADAWRPEAPEPTQHGCTAADASVALTLPDARGPAAEQGLLFFARADVPVALPRHAPESPATRRSEARPAHMETFDRHGSRNDVPSHVSGFGQTPGPGSEARGGFTALAWPADPVTAGRPGPFGRGPELGAALGVTILGTFRPGVGSSSSTDPQRREWAEATFAPVAPGGWGWGATDSCGQDGRGAPAGTALVTTRGHVYAPTQVRNSEANIRKGQLTHVDHHHIGMREQFYPWSADELRFHDLPSSAAPGMPGDALGGVPRAAWAQDIAAPVAVPRAGEPAWQGPGSELAERLVDAPGPVSFPTPFSAGTGQSARLASPPARAGQEGVQPAGPQHLLIPERPTMPPRIAPFDGWGPSRGELDRKYGPAQPAVPPGGFGGRAAVASVSAPFQPARAPDREWVRNDVPPLHPPPPPTPGTEVARRSPLVLPARPTNGAAFPGLSASAPRRGPAPPPAQESTPARGPAHVGPDRSSVVSVAPSASGHCAPLAAAGAGSGLSAPWTRSGATAFQPSPARTPGVAQLLQCPRCRELSGDRYAVPDLAVRAVRSVGGAELARRQAASRAREHTGCAAKSARRQAHLQPGRRAQTLTIADRLVHVNVWSSEGPI